MNHCSVFADAHPLHSFPVCFCLASNLSLHKQQYNNPPNNYDLFYVFISSSCVAILHLGSARLPGF